MGWLNFFGSKKKNLERFLNRGAIIVDVRTKEEYARGAIVGAKHIPLDILSSKVSEVKKWNKPIITYCRKGGRSAMAANLLRSQGVEVLNAGGYTWLSKNL